MIHIGAVPRRGQPTRDRARPQTRNLVLSADGVWWVTDPRTGAWLEAVAFAEAPPAAFLFRDTMAGPLDFLPKKVTDLLPDAPSVPNPLEALEDAKQRALEEAKAAAASAARAATDEAQRALDDQRRKAEAAASGLIDKASSAATGAAAQAATSFAVVGLLLIGATGAVVYAVKRKKPRR